jgi:hypothetical protein
MIDGNLLSSFSIMPSYADAIVPILKSPSEVAPTNACVRGDPGRGTRTSRRTVVAQVLTYAAALFGLDPERRVELPQTLRQPRRPEGRLVEGTDDFLAAIDLASATDQHDLRGFTDGKGGFLFRQKPPDCIQRNSRSGRLGAMVQKQSLSLRT